jgi:transcriptional regulator with AAA-type ATPase domain
MTTPAPAGKSMLINDGGGRASAAFAPSSSVPTIAGRWTLSQVERLGVRARHIALSGEAGTGKRHLARALHARWTDSPSSPLVEVDCATHDLYRDVFGHEGRTEPDGLYWRGALEQSEGGTILLTRFECADDSVRRGVTRFLQDGRFVPSRGDDRCAPDCTLVVTAHETDTLTGLDLLEHVKVPPLKERRGDAEDLFWHFAREEGFDGFPIHAVEYFASLPLPGNVRELRERVHREVAYWRERCAISELSGEEMAHAVRRAWQPPGSQSTQL